ncbi:MAG: RICIN domain-containing protein [Bacteroidaceae bacterium]|nr:RICIN domain-containing protein [Bacteroidaceae bacterium]
MKRLLIILFASCMLISASAQSVTTASSSMTASPWAQQVPFDIAAEGQKFNFTTGMGGWSWDFFGYKERNWVGKNATVARLNFFGRDNTSGNLASSLSEEQLRTGITFEFGDGSAGSHNGLDTDLAIIDITGVKDILLLCDMDMRVKLKASDWNNTNRVNYYVNDIALAVKYIESKGYNVISVAPFNEPDLDANQNCGDSAPVYNTVAAAMQKNPTLKGRVCGPNTLNTDEAVTWYKTVKNSVDFINTHQLAGSFEHLIEFWKTGIADGKRAAPDEMHNVLEAMVAMNYGAEYGTWWGYEGVTRAEFANITSNGRQLTYIEDIPSFAVAGVYRYDSEADRAKAIIGTSERQAVATKFNFISQDRLAYFDGYGPAYDYMMDVPGGTAGSYMNGQTNAERTINIYTGEDVPVEPVNGQYKIVNKASGKVLSLPNGDATIRQSVYQWADGGLANQAWDVYPINKKNSADYSYVVIRNANTSTFPLYLDATAWAMDKGANVNVWSDGDAISTQPNGWQRWYLDYVGDGYYHVINHDTGLYLAVDGGSTANGANVYQWVNDGSDKLLWKFLPTDHAIDATAPATPTGLIATPQSGAVKLTWAANSDADIHGYMVYRYNTAVGIWECIGRKVQGTTFLDNTCRKGQPLRYRIRAIDEAYNLSEASAEVQSQTTSDKALIAQWIGLSLKDNTPNKMHAVANGVDYTTDGGHTAFSFDGSDDYLKLPYHAGDMKEMTFAAWVKSNSTSAWQRIFDFGNGEGEYLFLTPTNGSKMRFEIKKGGVTQGLDATTTLGTGTWKHIAVTIGTNEVAIYINGVKNASTTGITLRPSDVAPAISYLGRSQFVADPAFNGMMSDVRLYNYALSADEVKNISSEIVSVNGVDITAERIPNIADNVNNWTFTGSWTTWTSSTEDATNLTSPYVRTSKAGGSTLTKTLTYLPEGEYKLSANAYAYYYGTRNSQQLFLNDHVLTINSARNRTATLRSLTGSVSSDHTMEFGIKTTSTSSATNIAMDNVTLVYQGTTAEYIEGIENITYEMTSEASSLTGRLMNAAIKQALLDVLSGVEATLVNFTSKIASGTSAKADADAWIAAMEAVESKVVAAKLSVDSYIALGSQITAARTKAVLYPQKTCGNIDEFGLDVIYSKYVNGEYLDSEIPAAVIEVKGITNRYVMADAVEHGSASNPIDVTRFIVEQAGFDNDVYAPWQASPAPGVAYGSVEFWNTNFTFSQLLYGMPAGTYRLQTRAFYRYGYQDTNYSAHNNGTLQRNAKLYISHPECTSTADIMAISDDPSDVHEWGAWYSAQTYGGKWVPDNMQAASEAIDVRGKYQPMNGYNSVDITVSNIGDLTIGAKKETLVGGDWTFIGDFTLYYLGDGKHRVVLDEKSEVAPEIDESIIYDEVTLKRTLKAGVWNTFVSPFDIPAHMLGNWEVKELVHSSFKGEVLSLTFDNAADGIKAGVPYMVRDTTMTEHLTEIKMSHVQLCAAPQVVTTPEGHVAFTGVYHYGPMPEGAFFFSNNVFYQVPSDGDATNNNKSKAFRAYLMPQGEAAEARSLSYRTDGQFDDNDNDDDDENGDDTPGDDEGNGDDNGSGDDTPGDDEGNGDDNGSGDDTPGDDEGNGDDNGDDNGNVDDSVDSSTAVVTSIAIYNTAGERLETMQVGLNVILMSDGSIIKVMVRE